MYYDGTLILGVRHFDSIMRDTIESYPEKNFRTIGHVQGFVDNKGVFHTREEAWVIADAAGQIIRRCGGDEGKLFSENLY
jgi:hypothetical protein